jgi:diguanylate cyclase (GGDEF)-like protein/putative nucleotidyltransferase with HDIG domain
MQRLSITYKLTALLALLSTAPLVFLVFSRTSEEISTATQVRFAACEQLALGCSLQLKHQDYRAIEQLLDQFMQRTECLGAIRLIRFDGLVIHQLGVSSEFADSLQWLNTAKHLRIPILRSGNEWGSIEAVYQNDPAANQLWRIAQAIVSTLSLNLLTFGMLLKRSLAVLDSGSAVPKRVRHTLDTIVGGVVILDANRKIVMANEAFQSSCKRKLDSLLGTHLGDIPFRSEQPMLPWDQAVSHKQRQSGATLFLEDGELERCFVVNATPIFDSKEAVAGALISFEDVTNLEQQKQSLMLALSELEISKDQIHKQNLRLQELASRDVLTGAFNRRSLYEQLEVLWTEHQSSGQALNCIMFDVDHFKKLNDNHGHAVGDQVLKDVARTIQQSVPAPGFAGRYGGEEFCVVLPAMSAAEATQVGEAIRQAIETQLAEPYRVTASLGVSGSEFGATSFQAIIEQADQGLYAAKHAGRNAVRCWSPTLAAEEVVKSLAMPTTSEQPISYHAVASLHSALAYRDADTALHSQRVAEMSVSLARGLLTASELYVLEIAALLHDIGKIGVPDSVLLKPAKLTPEEWKIMEAHARMGVEIVESSFNSKPLSDMVRYHHFRFDGVGTPEGGPVGADIPIGARIICIVDAYDAMVSNRVYRKGRPAEQAFAELRRCAGTQFDSELVERFIAAQVGWRADSRFMQSDMEAKEALAIGHLTERTMHAFEIQDTKILVESLEKMAKAGEHYDLPAIRHLATELKKAIGEARTQDWSFATPLLQDLLDMCLMVQRAHIREVAARPQDVENCPQSSYYSTARAWWEADQV